MEGASLLNNSSYSYEKVRMKIFIKSMNERAWCIALTSWEPPLIETRYPKFDLAWMTDEKWLANANTKSLNIMFCNVDDQELRGVLFECTTTMKRSKLQMLTT